MANPESDCAVCPVSPPMYSANIQASTFFLDFALMESATLPECPASIPCTLTSPTFLPAGRVSLAV